MKLKSIKNAIETGINKRNCFLGHQIFGLCKATTFISLFVIICFFTIDGFAQQHFTTLKTGDYETVDEDTRYLPGAKISGRYKAFYDTRREGLLLGSDYEGTIQQDIELYFQSKINTHISVHASIQNHYSLVTEQEIPYESKDYYESADSTSDEGLELIFGVAYLEYNHNPNASLKVGRQLIDIADRKGLIFRGTATAITQGCRIGTWCYYIGGARIGLEGSDAIFWAQLDYPVYESGALIKDLWNSPSSRQEKSFNVEIFRVMYRGRDVPLAKYGGWTGKNSIYHDTLDDQKVYYDNEGTEYMGFNLGWNYYSFILDFTWSNLTGSRTYHTGTQKDGGYAEISDKSISGNAYYLQMTYHFIERLKGGVGAFYASGDDYDTNGEKIWERNSNAYHEIKKGDHGDALIYFYGKDNIGDGHSVSNLAYYSLGLDYRTLNGDVILATALYNFRRANPIFVEEDVDSSKKRQDIGNELDFTLTWFLEERLSFRFFAAYLEKNGAYASNDSLLPDEKQKDITLLGANLTYQF